MTNRIQPFYIPASTPVPKRCPLHPWASWVGRECPACDLETQALIREAGIRDAAEAVGAANSRLSRWLWAVGVAAFGAGCVVGRMIG